MLISGFFFISWRLGQLITLIPPVGMLVRIFPFFQQSRLTNDIYAQAWFIDGFVKENMLTPTYILVIFIISVLAVIWALGSLLRYGATKRSAIFVSFVDLCFLGAFIASVYQLRDITRTNCNSFGGSAHGRAFLDSLGPFGYWGRGQDNPLAEDPKKVCAMLKTSFAFGIMNVVSFFVTAFLASVMHRAAEKGDKGENSGRRGHSTRRGHGHGRRRNGSTRRSEYHV